MVRVGIADAQDLTRLGLMKMLGDGHSSMQLVGVAQNKRELKDLLRTQIMNVLFIDPLYNDILGWQSLKQIHLAQPSCQIILIADGMSHKDVQMSVQLGCKGFLTKSCDNHEILQAIFSVTRGNNMMCHKILELVHDNKSGKANKDCSPYNLSPRELEIIKHTTLGKSAKTIAGDLFLSTHTVYTHKKNIMKKLGVNTTSELILYALDHNLTSR
jgi:DNA-binding NarL/FixJ family response regulator